MFTEKEVKIGVISGLIIISAVIILYNIFAYDRSYYPPKQPPKFLVIGQDSFRDWAFRLNNNKDIPDQTAVFRSHLISLPLVLKDIQIIDLENEHRKILGQFEGIEEQQEAFGKFEALVGKEIPTKIDVEVFSAKLGYNSVSANRIGGKLSITETRPNAFIEGTLQMGSINYGGLPFGATSLNIKGDYQAIGATVNTQISGHQGTVLNISADFIKSRLANINGSISIKSPKDLAKTIYLTATGKNLPDLDLLETFKDVNFSFQQDVKISSKNSLKLDLDTEIFGNDFQGIALLDKNNNTLKIAGRMKDYWIKEFPYKLKKISGSTTTQGIIDISLNQVLDDKIGPFSTKLENLTLKKNDFVISNINTLIKYKPSLPIQIEDINIQAESMQLDDQIVAPIFSLIHNSENNDPSLTSIKGIWKDSPIELDVATNDKSNLPEFFIKKDYNEIINISDILGLDLKFSGPVEFKKSWRFIDGSYKSTDLSFKNTAPGILTLNENVPELSNIYIKNMQLELEDNETALLTATGKHPLLYGDKPIRIKTKLQRNVDE